MKFIQLTDKVKTCCSAYGTLYFVKNRELYKIQDHESVSTGVTFQNDLQELKFDTTLFINDNAGKGILIDAGEALPIDYYLLAQLSDDQLLVSFRDPDNKRMTGILDRTTGAIVKGIAETSLIFKIHGSFLYQYNRRSRMIECFSLVNDANWQFNLSSLSELAVQDVNNPDNATEVIKLTGVLDNKLWVALNHHTLIALDAQTGELVHQLSAIPELQSAWLPSAIPAPEAMVIDEKRNRLIGFMWEFYWEIDPATGDIELTDLTADLKPLKIRNDMASFVLTDTHIYFVSHNESAIGAFHIEKKVLDWQYTFAKNEQGEIPRIKEIKGNEQIIGAVDAGGNLYVFETE